MIFELDLIELFKIVTIGLIGLGTCYLLKIWNAYKFFEKRGISTPKIEFIYGNFRQLRGNYNYSLVVKKWTETYGKTYGIFEGHLPILITSDLDIIQEVFIKQSTNFSARKKESLSLPDESKYSNLFGATKLRWKNMRSIMNPTFSSAKLRQLNPLIITCADRLLHVVEQSKEQEIDVSNYFKRFTMDTIWNCAFGHDIDAQRNIDNEYFNRCENFFSHGVKLRLLNYLGVYVHEIKELIFMTILMICMFFKNFIDAEKLSPYFWLGEQITEIVKKTKPSTSVKRNYIQLLLEANKNEDVKNSTDSLDYRKAQLTKHLSIDEIKGNLVLFMLAGYETTSTTLTYIAYILATHPEEQKILIDEIDSHYNDTEIQPNSDNINDLTYLEMFLKETLRLYPIANPVVGRRCTNPTNIKGIDIPLDLTISVDVLSLHMDPELWGPKDPHEFYPLRFSSDAKRNMLAYMPFGQGPRNCIGMKFALIELKLALIKILKKFEIQKGPNTPENFGYQEGLVRSPNKAINVIFKKRSI